MTGNCSISYIQICWSELNHSVALYTTTVFALQQILYNIIPYLDRLSMHQKTQSGQEYIRSRLQHRSTIHVFSEVNRQLYKCIIKLIACFMKQACNKEV
jgi:hypothetical protein